MMMIVMRIVGYRIVPSHNNERLVVLQVALVGQEPVLYARSVKENVAYGLDCWDLALVERATKLANAHEFITSMTDKYDTNTGEKGLQLSGMRTCSSLCSWRQ